MVIKNEKGVALITAMFFTVVLYALSGIFLLRVINESQMARREIEQTKSFYASQGATQLALDQLDVLINDYLMNTIISANPNGVISFANNKVNSGDGLGWLLNAVRDNNNPVLTQDGDEALYSEAGNIGDYSYQYAIVITEKNDPVDVGLDAWDFPYSYKIEGSSVVNGIFAQVNIIGDFTIRLRRDNFAKFALFTNEQETQAGTNVWFTERTNFSGPVHTNDRFNFALNPSGTFEELISQQQQMARFYNNGNSVLLDADANGTRDVPVFNDEFRRNQPAITFNPAIQEQDMADQATGGQSFGSNGIYVPNDGNSLTGGIYVRGDSNISLSKDMSDRPVYTVNQGSNTSVITLDLTNQQTTVLDVGSGSSQTYNGLPDGVDDAGTLIYVNGTVNNLSGMVQEDSAVTVASKNDIISTNHLQYEDFTSEVGTPGTPGYVPPSVMGKSNLMGIISWQGNVRIGTTAPDGIQVHGTVMAPTGVFQVDNYNQGSPRGTATLLGGVITDDYGAFGTFNGSTGLPSSGYGRNFVYDQRMQAGQAPPYFPTLQTFIAFSNDIVDKLVWQEGE